MLITAALFWRYATKGMTGQKIPQEKLDVILDAIALAPSSLGLKPYSVLIIENKELMEKIKPISMVQPQIAESSALLVLAVWSRITTEKINACIQRMLHERNEDVDSLQQLKVQMEGLLKNSDAENLNWSAKQAYKALDAGLAAAAEAAIDSTPIEGSDNNKVNDLLGLQGQRFRSSVFMTLGCSDDAQDHLSNLKKVRREKEKLLLEY